MSWLCGSYVFGYFELPLCFILRLQVKMLLPGYWDLIGIGCSDSATKTKILGLMMLF